ncbi:hypothetical protein SORBI_3002G052800 [Sorghum bicolor]|uniref:Protein FAR1-RELATED SEQUENCE n=2 Tax=Sorghum bicolor TaxID=4558 RepID=A0A1W0W2D7_SORBI|nr:hypothetical protein SORBI_3002G052800 [Sorghum bicolor]
MSIVVIRPSVGMSFDSRAEAYDFYNLHSWELGFGIRCNMTVDKSVVSQDIVCSCEGKPELSNTASAQTDCKAMIRLHRSDDSCWYIQEFRGDHNHPLSGICSENFCWPSHNHLKPYTKNLVRRLRDDNVELSKKCQSIYEYFWGMECKDISLDLSDIDSDKTIELFDDFGSLRRDDPSFMFCVELDDIDNQFNTVLWTNGRSRTQYAHFGDTVTFDTTYRTNLYGLPFILFVGVNNHHQSILLGGALMRRKTVESFKWLFREFVILMGGKAPSTILTDRCHEMEVAIQEELPETIHRWCKMHVLNNEHEFLGPICLKMSGFKDDFQKIIDGMLTVREFECAWQHLLDKYNLHDNAFLSQIYDSRHKWANPYLKEKFCTKQTSTQRNESAENMFKGYVPLNRSINMFVRHYNKLQSDLNSKESSEENRSRKRPRFISKGLPIMEHAAKIYTRAMFEMFEGMISQSGSYVVHEKEKGKAYLARNIRSDQQESWSQVEFEVIIRAEDGAVVCECGFWEHMGMPCCHAVKVMIHMGMQEIPAGNIVKRWTMDARDTVPVHLIGNDRAAENSKSYRTSELFIAGIKFVKSGSRSDQAFEGAMAVLDQIKQELSELGEDEDVSELSEQSSISAATTDDATSTLSGSETD